MVQLEREYHFIIIDSEAGMEHISRGTIGTPDMLLIVSDPGARGLRTIARIREIALETGLPKEKIHMVFNQYKTGTAPIDIGEESLKERILSLRRSLSSLPAVLHGRPCGRWPGRSGMWPGPGRLSDGKGKIWKMIPGFFLQN
jgi:CO dehydrogenase nickel-insertion accessory protein CooC1